MFEKYDSEVVGKAGSGGEYDVQEGFGWTNAVVLKLLDTYGDELQCSHSGAEASTAAVGAVLLVGVVVVTIIV